MKKYYSFSLLFCFFIFILLSSKAVFSGFSEIPSPELRKSAENSGMNPVDFVNKLVRQYPLVVMGGDVFVKEHISFFLSLLPYLHKAKVDYILLDIGNTNSQKYLENFFNASKRDIAPLKAAFREIADPYGWGYEEFYRIFETIYDLNRTLSMAEKRLSILFIEKPTNWKELRKDKKYYHEYLESRGEYSARFIKEKIFREKKTAFYYGNRLNCITGFGKTFSNLLAYEMRPAIFSILLNGLDENEEFKKKQPLCDGKLDELLAGRKELPVAFDLSGKSLLGSLVNCFRINTAFKGITNQKWALKDGWDGLIYLGSPKNFHCITPDKAFYPDKKEFKEVSERNRFYCQK